MSPGNLQLNTTGYSNAAFGTAALGANTTGARNIAIGYNAGSVQPTGSDNMLTARRALRGRARLSAGAFFSDRSWIRIQFERAAAFSLLPMRWAGRW